MPYYHATWRRHLPSILKHGLGGAPPDSQNFSVEAGVYLARNPAVSVAFMIESYLESSDTIDITPSQVVEAICVLVIDDSRVTERLISADPNIDRTDITVLYRGIVDVTGMPILGVDDVIDSPVTVDEVTALPSGLSE
ncbi:hypothetical protein [Sinorhizobium americanum]|uniref:hypothetical protein n=1 Tax=Sinorhizobium americanum TaxID=194963 RepID=UPI0005638CC1|nr:hypothetical protein [Sinorhizobium americanum]